MKFVFLEKHIKVVVIIQLDYWDEVAELIFLS